MTRARVLLVEDDAALAELVSWHLEREDFEVERTADGEEAILLARENPPDLVLLDWMIEGVSGIEVCRQLRRMGDTANVPIIMLTARGEEEDRVRGLETGADDYVTKPAEIDEIAARIRALLRRPGPRANSLLENGSLCFDTATRQASVAGRMLDLGRREADLLEILMRQAGTVVRRAVIEDALYSFAEPVTPNAVEAIVSRLRRRLDQAGAGGMLHTIRGLGYMLRAVD